MQLLRVGLLIVQLRPARAVGESVGQGPRCGNTAPAKNQIVMLHTHTHTRARARAHNGIIRILETWTDHNYAFEWLPSYAIISNGFISRQQGSHQPACRSVSTRRCCPHPARHGLPDALAPAFALFHEFLPLLWLILSMHMRRHP